jgi:L-aminopeptidase/D-esterase-like protein
MFDGDTVFTLATGARPLTTVTGTFAAPARAAELDRLAFAAADAFARAIVHALLAAESIAGLAAYREIWPEV